MSTDMSIAVGLLAPAYRVFGRPVSGQPYVPDGPRITGSIVESWRKRRRYRWHLRRLFECSPELLIDIGLTEKEAEAEIAKPFWRP